jgi:hypothetical protein
MAGIMIVPLTIVTTMMVMGMMFVIVIHNA